MLFHFSPCQAPSHNSLIKMQNIKIEICPSGCSGVSARINRLSSGVPTTSTGQGRLQGSIPCSSRVMWWDTAPGLQPDTLLGEGTAPATLGQNKQRCVCFSQSDGFSRGVIVEWHRVLETPTPRSSAVGPDLTPSREPADKQLHFPPTERHRHRDLITAKALLFLSSFRKKTKRQGSGGGQASPCIFL